MKTFDQCPVCSGELVHKAVEKILRGGNHTAVVHAEADVCLHCGERLYATETIRRFEEIREKLADEDVAEFKNLGQSYQATA